MNCALGTDFRVYEETNEWNHFHIFADKQSALEYIPAVEAETGVYDQPNIVGIHSCLSDMEVSQNRKRASTLDLEQVEPSRPKRTKRRITTPSTPQNIKLSDLKLTHVEQKVIAEILSAEVLAEVLEKGGSQVTQLLAIPQTGKYAHIISKFKSCLRAERKSRKEKYRRVLINKLLADLAGNIDINPDEKDIVEILKSAKMFITRQKYEICKLRDMVTISNTQ